MKKNRIELYVFLVEVALALTAITNNPIADFLKESLGDAQKAFVTIFSTQFLIFIAYFMLRLKIIGKDVSEEIRVSTKDIAPLAQDVASVLSSTTEAKALYEKDFYKELGRKIKDAERSVMLAHLDTLPPPRLKRSEAESYYNNLYKQIKNKSNINFQRVERYSSEKEEYLEEMISSLSGLENFSLAILNENFSTRKLPYISVQLIDDRIVYLVAVAEHTSPAIPRDILIKDEEIFKIWIDYYTSQLWESCDVIIRNGNLKEGKWNEIKGAVNEDALPK